MQEKNDKMLTKGNGGPFFWYTYDRFCSDEL